MRDIIPLIAVIILLLTFIFTRECGSTNPGIQQHTDSIAVKKSISAAAHKAGEEIRKKMARDSAENKSVLKRKEMAISDLRGKLAAAVAKRPEILRDTVYILADSVIREQVGTITHLKGEIYTLRTDYGKLLRLKDVEIRVKSEMYSHLEAINTELYKSLNRERRRGKVLKWSIPAAVIGGVLIGKEI